MCYGTFSPLCIFDVCVCVSVVLYFTDWYVVEDRRSVVVRDCWMGEGRVKVGPSVFLYCVAMRCLRYLGGIWGVISGVGVLFRVCLLFLLLRTGCMRVCTLIVKN